MLIRDAAATVTDVVIEDLTFDQRSDNLDSRRGINC
jgi:hypothetical protein